MQNQSNLQYDRKRETADFRQVLIKMPDLGLVKKIKGEKQKQILHVKKKNLSYDRK